MFRKTDNIHFIGIGGAGMSGLAEVLLSLKFHITGSDIEESNNVKRLRKLGAVIKIGHDKKNIQNADVVVFSSAIKKNNPEILEAKRRKIPTIPRAELLSELMRLKEGIAIAGTHGKTTVTSMVGQVLTAGGLSPTMIIGGKFFNIGSHAKLGEGKYLVCEADESDGSFLKLASVISVVTNIDDDHLDYYGNINNLKKAFLEFINKTPFYGYNILCLDDSAIRNLLPFVHKKYYTYGIKYNSDFMAKSIKLSPAKLEYQLFFKNRFITEIHLNLGGIHNVLNSLAAIAVGFELGVNIKKIKQGLSEFKGCERRLQLLAEIDNIKIFDDYGHHPTEIKFTIEALKAIPKNRLIVIFQPHRYTRTKLLYKKFARCFEGVNMLYLTEIYPAGEEPINGVSTKLIYDELKKQKTKNLFYFEKKEDIIDEVCNLLKPDDVLLTLGAGNIYQVAYKIIDKLR